MDTIFTSPIATPEALVEAYRCIDCGAVTMASTGAADYGWLFVIGGIALVVIACLVYARGKA